MTAYQVRLDAFEGPLDLLMHLIEKNKINIYDIPIAALTEQYLAYLAQFREFNIDVASEFLVMAATLLQIKSRILLPKPKLLDEAEGEEDVDPRQELVERLIEYRKFKEVSAVLDRLAAEQAQFFFRAPEKLTPLYPPLENMELALLLDAFRTVLETGTEHTALVSREAFRVQDKIADILSLLEENRSGILFERAFARSGTRGEMIAAFLAMLELVKLRRVTIEQKYSFSPIFIRLREG